MAGEELFNFYIEIISLLICLVATIYTFGLIKLCDHKLEIGWRLIFLAYIFFIIDKLARILNYLGVIKTSYFLSVCGLISIILLTLAVIKFNWKIRNIINHKANSNRGKRK